LVHAFTRDFIPEVITKQETPMPQNPSSSIQKSASKDKKRIKSLNALSRVCIEGEGRDEWGRRYLKFSVRGSKVDIPPFAVDKLILDPKPLFAALANAGWNAFTVRARNELLEKLQQKQWEPPSFSVATRMGWNSGAYVLPDGVVGRPRQRLEANFADLDPAMLRKYRRRGTLKEWQQIARLADGNSRLMLALSLAFAGPILGLSRGPTSGGFQIWGAAESGKTTAAMVAGSAWGCHRGEGRREKGFVESWNSTAAKVEVTALAHNDGVLLLDETKRAGKDIREQAQTVTKAAFNLAEHTEKERLTNTASARSWRCYFLSTSNLSLAELARKGGVLVDAADHGRLADIPLPSSGHGIFEELHEFNTGEELADALQRLCRRSFGTAGRLFVRRLAKHLRQRSKRRKLSSKLNKWRRTYQKALKGAAKTEGLRPLNRISGRVATCFAAARLAIAFAILPWKPKRLLRAMLSCQLDQLRLADSDQPVDQPVALSESPLSKLIEFLDRSRQGFVNLAKKKLRYGVDDVNAVEGYRIKFNGELWFLLTSRKLDTIIGDGPEAKALKKRLTEEGLMAAGRKGRFVVQRSIFKGGKGSHNTAWVHAIKAKILAKAA
jgi:hypothetical protein